MASLFHWTHINPHVQSKFLFLCYEQFTKVLKYCTIIGIKLACKISAWFVYGNWLENPHIIFFLLEQKCTIISLMHNAKLQLPLRIIMDLVNELNNINVFSNVGKKEIKTFNRYWSLLCIFEFNQSVFYATIFGSTMQFLFFFLFFLLILIYSYFSYIHFMVIS